MLLKLVTAAVLTLSSWGSAEALPADTVPQRIISLAPTITETVFALGAESKLIAVTTYCKFPPEASKLPHLGGLFDTSLEKLLSLKPDLVIMLDSHAKQKSKLDALNIRTLSVANESIDEIFHSIAAIGKSIDRSDRARLLVQRIESEISDLLQNQLNAEDYKALVVVDSNAGPAVSSAYAAGTETFYDDVLHKLRLSNAAAAVRGYSSLSAEGLAALNPDVIIDISLSADTGHREQLASAWSKLSFLKAVRNNHVYLLRRDLSSFPGPRVAETIKVFSSIKAKVLGHAVNN